jgi:hypothetical protein
MDQTGPDQRRKAEETGVASMQVHQSHRSLRRTKGCLASHKANTLTLAEQPSS